MIVIDLNHGYGVHAMIDKPLNLVKPSMLLWLNDARGVYIPRDFAGSFADRAKNVSGVTEDEWKILEAGPDTAWHWETWDNVLNNCVVTDDNGVKFTLHQDGDLWLVPDGMVWTDNDTFEWPEEPDGEFKGE